MLASAADLANRRGALEALGVGAASATLLVKVRLVVRLDPGLVAVLGRFGSGSVLLGKGGGFGPGLARGLLILVEVALLVLLPGAAVAWVVAAQVFLRGY